MSDEAVTTAGSVESGWKEGAVEFIESLVDRYTGRVGEDPADTKGDRLRELLKTKYTENSKPHVVFEFKTNEVLWYDSMVKNWIIFGAGLVVKISLCNVVALINVKFHCSSSVQMIDN